MSPEAADNTTITTAFTENAYVPVAREVLNISSMDNMSNYSSLQPTLPASTSRCWVCESSAPVWGVLDGMDSCAARFLQGCFALPW
jgi:hypothetical protein